MTAPHPVFVIPVRGAGRLRIMPCPPSERLADCVAELAAQGVDLILSLLEPDEAQALGLGSEAEACAAHGLTFLSHPVPDFGVPEPVSFAERIKKLADHLERGGNIAVHCRAGIGRSGMLAACVLIAQGESAETALGKVANARGVSVPETVEQGGFIATFARNDKRDMHVSH